MLAALHADAAVVDLAAAAGVADHDGRAVGRRVGVAPLQQRDDDGPQVGALAGQPVFEALRAVLIALAAQDARVDEALKPCLQDVAGNPEAALELVEAMGAEECIAQDQERPALADELERAGDRAFLAVLCVLQHSCIIQRTW